MNNTVDWKCEDMEFLPRCDVCNARGGCSCYPEDKEIRFDRYAQDPYFKFRELVINKDLQGATPGAFHIPAIKTGGSK